jgi:cell division protein FtsL
MSVPAFAPWVRPIGEREHQARPRQPAPRKDPAPARATRRSSRAPLRFWIFAAAVVSCLVITVVALDSLLVQTDYAIRTSEMKVTKLQADHDVLVNQVAQLSSPSRVATWARAHGMVEPKAAVIIKIHGSPARPASGGEGG